MMQYIIIHSWCFANGQEGRYEFKTSDFDEAFARFKYLQLLIENDDYDFNAIIPDYTDGDLSYSVYEDKNSLMNRQDLSLQKVEVVL